VLVIFLTLIACVGAARSVAKQETQQIVSEVYGILTGRATQTA